MTQNLLVATDGSDISKKALEFARDYARFMSARPIVVYVIEHPLYLQGLEEAAMSGTTPEEFYSEHDPKAKEALGEARELLDQADADYRVCIGSPAEEIVAVAEAEECFHIVVGSQDLAGKRRMVPGGVAQEVVSLAACPVTVVRSRERAGLWDARKKETKR